MKVAIIGYGKMGQVIEPILVARGHEVVARYRSTDPWKSADLRRSDLALEFTHPSAAVSNLEACLDAGIPVVTGTTGWYDQLPSIRKKTEEKNGALFYASNFSLGVNLFNEIVRQAAVLFAKHAAYAPALKEIHHIHKKDAPSGTALTLAESVLSAYNKLHGWTLDGASNALRIEALREGDVKGYHEVQFNSTTDRIVLSHEAHSRDGFALGAVLAAEWLLGKQGVFGMRDLLNLHQ